jgi:hypothetical protein
VARDEIHVQSGIAIISRHLEAEFGELRKAAQAVLEKHGYRSDCYCVVCENFRAALKGGA